MTNKKNNLLDDFSKLNDLDDLTKSHPIIIKTKEHVTERDTIMEEDDGVYEQSDDTNPIVKIVIIVLLFAIFAVAGFAFSQMVPDINFGGMFSKDKDEIVQTIPDETPDDGAEEVPSEVEPEEKPEDVVNVGKKLHEDLESIYFMVNKDNVLYDTYEPELKEIPAAYSVSEGYRGRPEAVDAFVKLVDGLYNDTGLWMMNTSSYRSYDTQSGLYQKYVTQLGQEEADKISAKPGTSEHQTGLAFDLVAGNYSMENFGLTKQYQWVKDNAHKYGFVIRYQEGKESITGYSSEEWHIRYLGVEVATKLYEDGIAYEELVKIPGIWETLGL